ncbi:MAG: 5-formyltetrahydrofolate cyclo-ligase [Persephonella sp.]|nr:MAG: 5-formyltetrahydrofolate cyclo-ligase [Persephonella sp.]
MVFNEDKNSIRKKILSIRETYRVSNEEIERIKEKFLSLVDKYKSNVILLYYPYRNEVDTKPIIRELLKRKKTVLLPKVEKNRILPIFISDISDLKEGFAGIKEPEGKVYPKEKIDIVVVPAVAYDRKGYRLGYGKGFYDRFLKDFQNLKGKLCFKTKVRRNRFETQLIGLAYDFQVLDKLPHEKHDIPVDIIITPKEVIKTERGNC